MTGVIQVEQDLREADDSGAYYCKHRNFRCLTIIAPIAIQVKCYILDSSLCSNEIAKMLRAIIKIPHDWSKKPL